MSLWSKIKTIGKVGLAVGFVGGYAGTTLPFSYYEVHKTKFAAEKLGGAIVDVEKEAGPHLTKFWYIPGAGILTTVESLDNRLKEYKDTAESVTTREYKNIAMDRFCKWRISDPVKYLNSVRSEQKAQTLLDDIVFDKVWEAVSSYTFEENLKTKRSEIRQKMIDEANQDMYEFGIEIEDLRIKKANIPEKSRPKIHDRMKSEIDKRRAKIEAAGENKKRQWLGKRDEEVKTTLAEATNEVQQILGKADQQVAELYKGAYGNEDKDKQNFYMFWESMQTMEALTDSNPTLILSTDNPLLKNILNGGEFDKKHLDFEVEPVKKQ
ncbi:MAG: hypothetical protein KKA79_01660 [Nanoarchaeota archaeon]|nr:hypothetical protein [Nanoarchaeota archaeon]MCG2718450.1 hypothetical protein [Nanoarchaeota archaeon]